MNVFKGLALMATALLFILTIVPASGRPVTVLSHDIEHFSAFCATGMLYGLAFDRRLLQLAALALAFATVLECVQIPLATRHARLEDWVVDSAALCVGILVGRLIRTLMSRFLVSPR
jgi:VanZ family protein